MSMSAKRLISNVFILLALCAGAALSQKLPAQGTTITVCQSTSDDDACMYSTIQAAVNAARASDVIEIMDTEIYYEQVTFDGRATSPWTAYAASNGLPAIQGNSNGVTLRFVPPDGTPPFAQIARPTIRYMDLINQSPRNTAESQQGGEVPGGADNFGTNGTLRILHARNVTIDGIIIHGGQPQVFSASGFWGGNFSHGNAAVTMSVAGGVIIRNCEIRNAYNGIYTRERNVGGIFAHCNPDDFDCDDLVPIADFGKTGGSLFEYNRIHSNGRAFYFESAWDLASTVRHNLIYGNKRTDGMVSGHTVSQQLNAFGAFAFKDIYISPLAIYNNTLFDNTFNFMGLWQIGYQHLIFNNIFSRSLVSATGGSSTVSDIDNLLLDNLFPHRMYNIVMSANNGNEAVQMQQQGHLDCAANWNRGYYQGVGYVRGVSIRRFGGQSVDRTRVNFTHCSNPNQTDGQDVALPGAIINTADGGGGAPPSTAQLRWLQTDGHSVGLPVLFKSIDPDSPNFLVPDWDNQQVKDFIMGRGWVYTGTGATMVRRSDGANADLGAIQSTGQRQRVVARITPSDVVSISGSSAIAYVHLNVTGGELNSPTLRFLRWVTVNPERGRTGVNGNVIPSTAITNITPPNTVLRPGSNTIPFNLPLNLPDYGFFELAVEGTDPATGNTVMSDIGFMPYRQLQHRITVEVFPRNGAMTEATRLGSVYDGRSPAFAGDTVRLRITATNNGVLWQDVSQLQRVMYDLLSDPAANMYCVSVNCPTPRGNPLTGANPFVRDDGVTVQKVYDVVFTHAGEETIRATGRVGNISLIGTGTLTVRSGPPFKVAFHSPIPKSQLGGGRPPAINIGLPFDVQVEAQDRYGNPVDRPAAVSIATTARYRWAGNVPITDYDVEQYLSPINNVGIDTATGIATFVVRTTVQARPGDVFDMTATLAATGATDVGALRVGQAFDILRVFYDDVNDYDPDAGIDTVAGAWVKITVKAARGNDVITERNGHICISSDDDGLIFSNTPAGSHMSAFPMTNGVSEFWVTAHANISGDIEACVYASALAAGVTACGGQTDNSIGEGMRCNIKFSKPDGGIDYATVFGDGHGRPDSLILYYKSDGVQDFDDPSGVGLQYPDSVRLTWPLPSDAWPSVAVSHSAGHITKIAPYTLSVDLRHRAAQFPPGYTEILYDNGRGLLSVYGGSEGAGVVANRISLVDSIGPVFARTADSIPEKRSPAYVEKKIGMESEADTLAITTSEAIRSFNALIGSSSILYYNGSGDPNLNSATFTNPALSASITVDQVMIDAGLDGPIIGGYKLIISSGPVPQPGGWVRFNPVVGILDGPGNAVHPENRWVQVTRRERRPETVTAHYTANPRTGQPDYAYVTFDKKVDLNEWFSDGYFKFGAPAGDSIAGEGNPARFLTAPGDTTTLRIDLDVALPSMSGRIMTAGVLPLTIGWSSSRVRDHIWMPLSFDIGDGAAPVLADTVVYKFGKIDTDGTPLADTLDVTYSEMINGASEAAEQPVKIWIRSGDITPTLSYIRSYPSPRGWVVRYKVTGGVDINAINRGDTVRISHTAGIGDIVAPDPNVQDYELNRWVPLKLDWGEIEWKVRVKNNPFRGGGSAGVLLDPQMRGATLGIDYTVSLFDNMGNLVSQKKRDNLDADGPSIEWSWYGYNINGRMVGSGTYLLRANMRITKVNGVNVTRETYPQLLAPYSVRQAIGFVR